MPGASPDIFGKQRLTPEPAFVGQLTDALQNDLRGEEVRHEDVRGDRFRFVVVWHAFDSMDHPERQQLVWTIAERVLRPEDLLNVAMILTLGAEDVSNG